MPVFFLVLASFVRHPPLIVIDSGHTPSDYGAVSCTGKKEIDYNDELLAAISGELARKDRKFILTRTRSQPIRHDDYLKNHLMDRPDDEKWQKKKDIYSRIALANVLQAGLFISIHHDSVQEHRLSRTGDGKIVDVRDDYKQQFDPGYSIYIANDPGYPDTGQHYPDSLKFAEIFARKMQAMGRNPSTYPEKTPDTENYQAIDASMGIYNSRGLLTVLRNAKMPAVLIEVGVIVDVEDERVISSPSFKNRFAKAIADSIDEFWGY